MPSPTTELITTMDFVAAIKSLTDGAKVHKLEWQDREYFGVLRNGRLQLHKPDGQYHDWIISDGDLQGTDWITL